MEMNAWIEQFKESLEGSKVGYRWLFKGFCYKKDKEMVL